MSNLFAPRLSAKEQTLFAKRLAYLMRAGVPILDSLNLLKEQMRSKSSRDMFGKIVADVANGQFLHMAMGKFKTSFSDFVINIIKIGETSGILSENLEYLAEELKKKQALRRKIVSALFYPIFIVIATLGMSGVLTVVVFPKVLPIFASVGANLPITTKVLIAVSRFLISYGIFVVLGLIAAVVGFGLLMRVPVFRYRIERLILRLPLAGKISQSYQLSNMCRTLGLLIKGSGKLEEALAITAATTDNLVYRAQLKNLVKTVSGGDRISVYMNSHRKLFPDMISHMVAVGETTGNLSDSFLYLAEMYEQDLDDLTKNLSGLLEPILMVFMGLLVGFVAVSIITPIYSVTQKLKP